MATKDFNAIIMIAGTAIGAGTVAMPIACFQLGFTAATGLIVIMAAIMFFSAMITVKLNLYNNQTDTIIKLSAKLLGRPIKIISLIALAGLHYTLLGAYLSGLSAILATKLPVFPQSLYAFAIVIVIGLPMTILLRFTVSHLNRGIFIVKVIAFFCLIFYLFPEIKYDNLFHGQSQVTASNLMLTCVVFFTAFGFHGSIPFILKYLNTKDYRRIRKVMILGCLIPILIYTMWIFVSLGSLSMASFMGIVKRGSDAAAFISAINQLNPAMGVNLAQNLFTIMAILTSFIGVGIILFDFMIEQIPTIKNKLTIFIMVFVPQMIFVAYFPTGYILGLELAAVFLSILALIIPGLCLYKINKGIYDKTLSIGSIIIGAGIIGVELYRLMI